MLCYTEKDIIVNNGFIMLFTLFLCKLYLTDSALMYVLVTWSIFELFTKLQKYWKQPHIVKKVVSDTEKSLSCDVN